MPLDLMETIATQKRSPSNVDVLERSLDHFVRVMKDLVYKDEDDNRLLEWLGQYEDNTGKTIYRAEIRILESHKYFFEHHREHLPGLYIIEAGRQLGLAVPHLFLDVSYDYHSVLDGCDMSFTGFANLTDPLFIDAHVLNPVYRKGKLQSLSFDGTFIQNNKPIVHYQSHVRLIHARLLKRLEASRS